MKEPCVSVIIPTYNRRELIREAIESALNQTLSEIEVIVVDNGSTDDTQSFVEAIGDPRLRYVKNPQPSKGPARPRNYGASLAKAPIIAFLDSDDRWEKGKLMSEIRVLEKPGVVGVCSLAREWDGERLGAVVNQEALFPENLTFEGLLQKNFLIGSGMVFKKETFNRIGGFYDPDGQNRYSEDWEMWLRASLEGEIRSLDEVNIHLRTGTSGGSAERNFFHRGMASLERIEREEKVNTSLIGQAKTNLIISGVHANFIDNPRYARQIISLCRGELFLNQKAKFYLALLYGFSFLPSASHRSFLMGWIRKLYRKARYKK